MMAHPDALSEWTRWVSNNGTQLPKPQATLLAWWRVGSALTRSCGRLTVATLLARLLQRTVATIEQRRAEWCLEAP
ncbi:MAG: endonuclease, partial [Chloroflexota bacterium]